MTESNNILISVQWTQGHFRKKYRVHIHHRVPIYRLTRTYVNLLTLPYIQILGYSWTCIEWSEIRPEIPIWIHINLKDRAEAARTLSLEPHFSRNNNYMTAYSILTILSIPPNIYIPHRFSHPNQSINLNLIPSLAQRRRDYGLNGRCCSVDARPRDLI
jgi:hypothetical protein